MHTASFSAPISFLDEATYIIAKHPHLHRRNVQCRVESNRMILEGEVNSFYEKQLAQEALRDLEGFEQVENQLEVITI